MEPMEPQGQRPRVLGIVGIALVRGLFSIWQGSQNLDLFNDLRGVPDWVFPVIYFSFFLAVVSIVAAVLIAMYRRWGLFLALAAFGLDVALAVLLFITGQITLNFSVLLNVGISLLVLYYVYIFLNRHPEKTHFT